MKKTGKNLMENHQTIAKNLMENHQKKEIPRKRKITRRVKCPSQERT